MTEPQPDPYTGEDDVAVGRIGQGLERLIAVSDGVIAIALTLLALELPVPKGDGDAEIWRAFVSYVNPEYLSFILSFVVISAFWSGHHRLFMFISRLGPGLVWRNFAFLFLIVLMPFATSLLYDDDSVLGTVFYAVVVTCLGLVRLDLVRHARRHGLLRRGADGPHGLSMLPIYVPTIGFGVSIPIAFVSTMAARNSWLVTSALVFVTVGLWRRRHRSGQSRPG